MDYLYVIFFTLSIVLFTSLIGRRFLEFFNFKTKLPYFSSQHNAIVGLTVALCIGSVFNSFELSYSNFLLLSCFLVIVYEIAKYTRSSIGSITSVRIIQQKVNKEFVSALFVSCLAIVSSNVNYIHNGYRTSGNNDPFDYIILSRIYESPNRTFLNLHEGWAAYSDRAGAFTTRLISIIQDVLPGNRYIDFLVFVCLTYFLFSLSLISFLRIVKVNLAFSIFFTTLILLSPTYVYILQQGFFQQLWGLLLLIIFISYTFLALRPKNDFSPRVEIASLILMFLYYVLLVLLSYFVFLFIMALSLIVFLSVMCVSFYQTRKFQRPLTAAATSSVTNAVFLKRLSLFLFIMVYVFCYLLDIIRINVSFLSEFSTGEYGWSRPSGEYFFGVQQFFPVIDGVVFLLATIFILLPLLSQRRTCWDYYAAIFSLLLAGGYVLFVIQEGMTKYQTWKYFSFVLVFTLLFAIKNLSDWYVFRYRCSNFPKYFDKFVFFLIALCFVFFVTQPQLRSLINEKANPSLSTVSLNDVNAVANLTSLEFSNVGFYLGSAGETMLISSLLPSESALVFSDSYYGKPTLDKLERIDYIFSRFDMIPPGLNCRELVKLSNAYFYLKRDALEFSCFSQILEKISK
jgi:hypothetical protein